MRNTEKFIAIIIGFRVAGFSYYKFSHSWSQPGLYFGKKIALGEISLTLLNLVMEFSGINWIFIISYL